jgi:hypothetical protein
VILAANPILVVNNQASVDVSYLPTQINNSPIENNSHYLKGHQLGLSMSIAKLFYERIYAQAALNATAGNLSYMQGRPRTTATSVVQRGGVRLGYLFMPHERIGLIPYGTLGYDFWQYDVGGINENGYIKNCYTNEKVLLLKQRFLFNVGTGSDYRFAKNWHALTQINYWYFKYGRSANSSLPPSDRYWYEPSSITRQLSVMVGIGYAA